jgi:hypothetical protein
MAKQALHFAGQFRHGRMEGFQARIDDDGALRIQPIQAEANGLSKPPLETIAHHGRAQGARDREANLRAGADGRSCRLADAKGREQRAGEAGTSVIDSSKIL